MRTTPISPDEAPWPTALSELASPERLIVWSFRRWVLGLRENRGDHWSLVWNEFTRHFGANDGRDALSGFAALIKGMQCSARRTIHYHQPCCPALDADEASIMCLVAACQHHQLNLARALAEWMVSSDGVAEMLDGGTRLARIMRRHALTLPERTKTQHPGSASAVQIRSQITMH